MAGLPFLLFAAFVSTSEDAAERAEEVGFVNLAYFPELPMPDILHCLQIKLSGVNNFPFPHDVGYNIAFLPLDVGRT
ncbi:hypothetical protein RND71_039717 [Anisodus tanguticus]|uniref:Uncharacterized protein n=1 Tax=Anisodus tanguticus TaxID=243964 RepID=A0AAE1UVL2_9SOLA|nr:hypothetical protein RND71_039717 [Anisodus tanguticus]